MNMIQKFKNGLTTASESFRMLWNNKKLLTYLGIPILTGVVLEIIACNITACPTSVCASLSQKDAIARILLLGESICWTKCLLVVGIHFFYLVLLTFQNISLTSHVYAITMKAKIGFRQIIKICIPKIKRAVLWALLTLIPIMAFCILNAQIQKSTSFGIRFIHTLLIFGIFAAWSLLTAFVIQIIAIEDVTVRKAIKSSIFAIKAMLFEFLGAAFWIGLISLISATPFMILEKYINMVFYITIPLVLLIYCSITSAYTVSKTLLYLEFKKR